MCLISLPLFVYQMFIADHRAIGHKHTLPIRLPLMMGVYCSRCGVAAKNKLIKFDRK